MFVFGFQAFGGQNAKVEPLDCARSSPISKEASRPTYVRRPQHPPPSPGTSADCSGRAGARRAGWGASEKGPLAGHDVTGLEISCSFSCRSQTATGVLLGELGQKKKTGSSGLRVGFIPCTRAIYFAKGYANSPINRMHFGATLNSVWWMLFFPCHM